VREIEIFDVERSVMNQTPESMLLESALKSEELSRRSSRHPDYEGENRALTDLNDAMANAPETLLQRLVDTALTLCRADSAGISILERGDDAGKFRWQAVAGALSRNRGCAIPREGSICSIVLDHDKPLLFNYPERYFDFVSNTELPLAEILLVPFHVSGIPIGTVWVVAHDPNRKFDLEDQRLLTSLSRVAAAAHKVTTALCKLGTEVDAITRLHDLSALLVQEHDVERLLEEILATAIAVGSADFGTIQLLEPVSGKLKIVAHRGLPQWWLDFWESVADGHGSCGTAMMHGKRIIVEDVEKSEVYKEGSKLDVQLRAGVRAVQSTPLISRSGKLLGVFSTHYRTPRQFDEWTLRMLDLLAWQAAELLDRTQTEIAMQRIEDRFRLLVETSSAVTWTSQASGLHAEPKPSWIEFTGQSDKEMMADNWTNTVHPDDLPEALRKWNESVEHGRPYLNEHRILRPDGQWCWMSVHAVPVRGSDGEIKEWIGMNLDISDRKQAEKELYDREATLQAILKTATDAIISIDETGTIINANPATEQMFGYTRAELIGNNIKMLMPNPFRKEHDGYLRRYIHTGERRIIGRSREASGRRRDGTIFPIELSVAEIDHERKFTGFIRDVTERKKLQRHLLNIVAEEQQRISCELHDGIQQELTGLSLFAGVLRQTTQDLANANAANAEQPSDPKATSLAKKKNSDALRLLQDASDRLTRGLADVHRHVQELAHGIMPVPIDAEGLRSSLDSLAKGVGPSIDCRFEHCGDVSIEDNSTASHVFRIAQEALTNAIRHGGATSILIKLRDVDGKFILEIEDNGCGFDPFHTTHGMGLRTMEYRASIIGGMLQLDRGVERGMIIRCIFPRHLGPTNHDPLPDPLAPVSGKEG
jgi:PAS domain S-box-containing protein